MKQNENKALNADHAKGKEELDKERLHRKEKVVQDFALTYVHTPKARH